MGFELVKRVAVLVFQMSLAVESDVRRGQGFSA